MPDCRRIFQCVPDQIPIVLCLDASWITREVSSEDGYVVICFIVVASTCWVHDIFPLVRYCHLGGSLVDYSESDSQTMSRPSIFQFWRLFLATAINA